MPAITSDSLMTLEAYANHRTASRQQAIEHRRLRTVPLGEHISVQFEDEHTIRRQIQEMLHIERIVDDEGVHSEIDTYAPLTPDGSNWKATLLIEYSDVQVRKRELARLIGVEDRVYVEVVGRPRIYAIADEDLPRENQEKTSAVHFLRFELSPVAREMVLAGARVKLGCDHVNYTAQCGVAEDTLASLMSDLSR